MVLEYAIMYAAFAKVSSTLAVAVTVISCNRHTSLKKKAAMITVCNIHWGSTFVNAGSNAAFD